MKKYSEINSNYGQQTVWLRITFLLGFLIFLFSSVGFAQTIPCLDAKNTQIKFVKITDRSLRDDCRNTHRKIKHRTDRPTLEVTISGHVTHQNGVRMSGITMTLTDINAGTSRIVITDSMGNYLFANVPWGSRQELTPSLTGYEFYPPAVIWEGIVEDEIWNFIAVGPPPPPPTPPANQPTLAWSSYFDNTPQLADYNGMIGRDAQGSVYVGGTSYSADTSSTDIALFKTDANGNRVWSRTFDGPGHYSDALRDMVVDNAGNAYLAGYTYSVDAGNPALNSYDFVVLKYDTNGDLVWTKYYGGNPGYDDSPQSLKVDAAGHVYVAGYSWGINTYTNYATVKFDTNGDQMWAKRFASGFGEIPYEVETDANGNVYVTGYSNSSMAGGSEDIVTIKYNAAGEQMWLNRYNSPENASDEGYELEVNAAGDVLVLGDSYDFVDTSRPIVHKINGVTGEAVWTRDLSAIDPVMSENPVTMKLTSDGSIVMAGMLYDFSYNTDSFVAKLDPEANIQWVRTYDGPSDEDYDGDPNMTLDANGNIYVGITSEGFANADIQVIKYTADGVEDWTYRFGNPFLGDDSILSWQAHTSQQTMLLDAQGNLYIAGDSYIPGQSTDLVAFKLEPVAQLRAVPFDFDGDRKADLSVFRPSTGFWYALKSSDQTLWGANWGLENDKLAPADYDGDGRYDPAVFRDGMWYVLKSANGRVIAEQFGMQGDRPVPSDFDNDGKADLSVYRQGTWYSRGSQDNAFRAFQFGLADDIPIPSDYDSNRRSDIAVFRNGFWYVQYENVLPMASTQFGISSDKAVPADYDGDKQTDYAVFRSGTWYIWQSTTLSQRAVQWGQQGDIPVPADYDGDKKADLAVFRAGIWYILRSSDNNVTATQFGLADDIPVPSAYGR